MSGIYHGRASVTVGVPNVLTWFPGQVVNLEGLLVRVKSVTYRPLTDEELIEWPDSNEDDKMVDVEFVEYRI